MCGSMSVTRSNWTDDELKENVRATFARIAAEEKEKSDTVTKRSAAQAKLENESKSTALRLKGLYPGITLEKADEYHPGIASYCRDASAPRDAIFNCSVMTGRPSGPQSLDTLDTLAGMKVRVWSMTGKGNVIWQIFALLDSSVAMEVGEALAQKYKSGVITAPTVTNRMGAKFENVTRTWRSGDLILKVERFGSSLDDGYITFSSTRAPRLTEVPKTKDL